MSIGRLGTPVALRSVAVVVLTLVVVACSGTSDLRELEHDASRDTIAGPRPTAPPVTEYTGPGLTADANDLLSQLRGLESERNLCTIMTSSTVADILAGDVDISRLATTPSGISQMIVAVDRFFAHVVEVSSPELQPSTRVVQRTWRQISEIGADANDREERTEAILNSPNVEVAVRNLATWMGDNCAGSSSASLDLGSLLGG